ncbi:MAG: serine/threonine protein kinase [Acidobacteria bacterium]|nr:serine/threonine protein kinase [Acidobacteriota bacterium]
MSPERWRRIDELFRTAADRSPVEREAYLTQACDGDETLRREVMDLLDHETGDAFFEVPIQRAANAVTTKPLNEQTDEMIGQRIGSYRLTRLIGRGGMGAVYEAVRDDAQFEQRVAVKLIRRGMDSEFVRTRFLRERQILAGLDHPYIARLFDGGATRDGLPYFVMEFVAGEPITDYCRTHTLSLNEKLHLFRDVCAAVQHAHQNLVVHRDLKPGNILVTEDGTPKLLDFGIAKLLTPEVGEALTRTETSLRMMTPDYASPEQVRGEPITTATDVYALGAVLYELLTGQRPHQFRTLTPREIERAICLDEPRLPSACETARQRGGETASTKTISASFRFSFSPSPLRGDLDNIVMMALRKEPARRYQSVEQFSEDIRRHLDGLPVVARKDTFRYRASKFARRHKVVVALIALLALFAVGMTWQAWRAARERDRANQEAATARAVTQSLVSVFEFADPGTAKGNAITAKELLDQGAEKGVRELQGQPVVQARLMDTLGGLYVRIGVYDRAQALMEESLTLRRQTLGAEHADVAESLHHLAALAFERGDYATAETQFRAALAMRRKLLGAQHLDVADSMTNLGQALLARGKFAEAEPLIRDALKLRRQQLAPEHKDIAASLHALGRVLSEQGKFAEAAEMYRQTLAIHRQVYGGEHPLVAGSLSNVAVMLQELGDYQGAEPLFREALAMRRKLLGEAHPDVALAYANLASVLQDKRAYVEAEQCYRQALALRRKLFGEGHLKLTITMNNLATLLAAKGDWAGCETLHRQTLAIRRKELGEQHPETATSLYNIANTLYHKGAYLETEKLDRQALAIYQKSLTPEHWMIQRSRSQLGAGLTKLKRFREAEAELLAGYEGLKAARGAQHELTRTAASRLVELYEAWGKPDQAVSYRALAK